MIKPRVIMSYIKATGLYSVGFLLAMVCMELLLEYTAKKFQNLFQGKGSLPASVTLSQFFACFLLPWLLAPAKQKVVINFYKSRQLLLNYGLITMLVFGATALATASLIYVAYPVKIVFKSSKLIPTMLVSICFFDKTYSTSDYCSALLLCLGTGLFVYDPSITATPAAATTESSSLFSPGVLLLLAAVTCDAFLPNIQKRMLNSVSPEELMVNSNLLGFLLSFLYMLGSGSVHDLIQVVMTKTETQGSLLLCMGLAGIGTCLAVAVYCYTHLIKESGPVVAVGVATLRKVVTLILSYVVFPKPLSLVEVLALCLIAVGMGVEARKRCAPPPPNSK